MTAGHLVIGWDGADLDVVDALGPAELPHLHAAMRRGAFARMEVVRPPATLPNWTTFLTGVDPGRHGVFDFTTREGPRVRFTGGTVRAAPTWAARLDAIGKACAVVGFPGTYPPEPLRHGVFVSGWDSPVAFRGDRSFVHPPRLHDVLVARFGPQTFDDVDEFDADPRGAWHGRLPDALVRRIERKTAIGTWLLGLRRWDLVALYFGESDTAAHHLWSLHDEESPRHRADAPAAAKAGLRRVYRALDEALGRLLVAAGGEGSVELTLVSDHGSGGSSDEVVYLNRVLADAGLLRFRAASGAGGGDPKTRALAALKDRALTGIPPRLRERAFRLAGGVLPSWLESRTRFGAIDFPNTIAFSDELNYFPAVHLNVQGREPEGVVPLDQVDARRDEVEAALRSVRHPRTGRPLVADVWRRDDLFDGPWVHRAPDLLLDLHPDPRGYTLNLMPSATAPRGVDGPFRRLDPDEHLGRKGRSLPGSHRPRGTFVAAGPQVAPVEAIDAHIADAAATVLARMGVAVPPDAAGRVLWECLATSTAGTKLPELPPSSPADPGAAGMAAVARRLRALGYID